MKRLRKIVAVVYADQKVKRSLHGVLYGLCGDHAAVAMLEQAINWQSVINRKRAVDGWWWKDMAEWQAEVGLTRRDIERARPLLANAGLSHAVKRRKDGKTISHYMLDFERLVGAVAKVMEKTANELITLLAGIIEAEKRPAAPTKSANDEQTAGMSGADIPESQNATNQQSGMAHLSMAGTDKESSVLTALSSVTESTDQPTTNGAVVVGEIVAAKPEKFFAEKDDIPETDGAPNETPPPVAPPPSPTPGLDVWRKTKHLLELQLERSTFETWLKEAWLVRVDGDEAPIYVLGLPNKHVQEFCMLRLQRTIWRAFKDISGRDDIDVQFEVVPGSDPALPPEKEEWNVFSEMVERGDVWLGPKRLTPAQMYERYFNAPPDDRLERIAAAYKPDDVEKAIQAASIKRGIIDPVAYIGGVLRGTASPSARA